MKGGYTNFKNVFWNIKKEPFTEDLSLEDAAEHALDFLKSLNISDALILKDESLKIEEHTATLPKNIMNLRGVRYRMCEDDDIGPMLLPSSGLYQDKWDDDGTYILKGCNLYISAKDGYVDVSYDTLPLDDEGFPLIPEFGSFPKAVALDVAVKHAKYLYYLGKIPQGIFQHMEQQRAWYVAQAIEQLRTPTYDEAVVIGNTMNRLITDVDLHAKGFKGMGGKEKLKRGM